MLNTYLEKTIFRGGLKDWNFLFNLINIKHGIFDSLAILFTVFCFHPESTKELYMEQTSIHVLLDFWILKFNSTLNQIRLLKVKLSVKINSVFVNHFIKKLF